MHVRRARTRALMLLTMAVALAGAGLVAVPEPSHAAEGDLVSADTAATGIRFDVHDDFLGQTLRDVDVFYPARDRVLPWRDTLQIAVEADGFETLQEFDFLITDANGATVGVHNPWYGGDLQGVPVPEGIYTVTVTVTDTAGNEETFQRDVRVSHEQLVRRTWQRRVAPRPYLVDKSVGRCAALRSPARPDWAGSFGFRSQRSCRRPGQAQTVSTIYRISPPPSAFGRWDKYDQIRVNIYGGAPRRADFSYIVQWYWSARKDAWVGRAEHPGTLGANRGSTMGPEVISGDPEEGTPYIYWSAGLSEGASYDLKTFTVQARYWTVR